MIDSNESLEVVAVFFDVQNLYHASKSHGGSKISYKHLIDEIAKGRELFSATAYTAQKDEKASGSFYGALKKSGIEVHHKKVFTKRMPDGSRKVIPVHFDVEIACDAKSLPERVTTVVLCTGNGNFAYLCDSLYNDSLDIEVWSFSESTSDSLKNNKKIKFVPIPKGCLLGEIEKEREEAKSA